MKINNIEQNYILQSRWPALQAKIEKINAKLRSEKAPELDIQVSEPELRKIGDDGISDLMAVVKVDISRVVNAPIGKIELLAETKIDLEYYKQPSIELLARTTIDKDSQLMLHTTFTTLTQEEEHKITGAKNPCFCDHCETNRPRIYMYTLKTEDGLKRVGSGCLETFSGFKMQNWKKAYTAALKLLEEAQQITFTEAAQHVVVPVELFICEAIENIEKRSYRSGYAGEISSGFEAFEDLRAKLMESDTLDIPYSEPTRAKATKIQAFIIDSELSPEKRVSDYYRNLRLLLSFGHLTVRQSGLLASALISHDKEVEHLIEIAKKSVLANEYYGAKGDKVILKNLRVDSVYHDDGQWGATTKISMYDESNRLFFWAASGCKDVERGAIVNVAGTIKDHKPYDSKKLEKTMLQNVLTRCTFHTPEEIEELINKPVKAKRAPKAKAVEESPSPF